MYIRAKKIISGFVLCTTLMTFLPTTSLASESPATQDRQEYQQVPWVDERVDASVFAQNYSDSPIVLSDGSMIITHLDKAKAPNTVGYTTGAYEMQWGDQTGGSATFSSIYTQHANINGVEMIYTQKVISAADVKAMCIATGGEACYNALMGGDYSKGFWMHGIMTTVAANGEWAAKFSNDGTGVVKINSNDVNYPDSFIYDVSSNGAFHVREDAIRNLLINNTYGWSSRSKAALDKLQNHYMKPLLSGKMSLQDFLMLAGVLGMADEDIKELEKELEKNKPDKPKETVNPYANSSRINEEHHTWHEADTLAGENGESYSLGNAIPSGKSLTNHVDAKGATSE